MLVALAISSLLVPEIFLWPYFVGGGILVALLLAMAAMLSFGKGREHS